MFTPSILTILGVIMYLRFAWVVGQTGLVGTWVIVTLCTSITLLTALSISQIASDQPVRTGGAYYMISRSLGIEVGGAVGVPLYIAQALSVALYTVGFAESINQVLSWASVVPVALVTTVAVAGIALVSAGAAIRAQYIIMGAIGLSLLSFFLGASVEPGATAEVGTRSSFWAVVAVFFPAVTGIMAGVNMSGDLKNPRRSIPIGTLAAVAVSYVLYMAIPAVLDARVTRADLISDPLVMRRASLVGEAILVGVWGATLSSALGSMLGGPRVLQALSRERVLPGFARILGRGHGPADEPRIATFVTLAIALVAVSLGSLDAIAPVLTMFFLTTYAVINLVSAIERFLVTPSFRPTFHVHWLLSLLGAIGCISVMLLINTPVTLLAGLAVSVVYAWMHHRNLRSRWGDVRQALWYTIVRWGIVRLKPHADARDWRPHVLVLSGTPSRRWYLTEFSNALTNNRTLLNVVAVLPVEHANQDRVDSLEEAIDEYLLDRGVRALVRVVRSEDTYLGAARLVEAYGIGPLVPNTVVMGDADDADDSSGTHGTAAYCDLLVSIYESRRNLILLQAPASEGAFGRRRRIDIWWRGRRGNGAFMVTIAHMLRGNRDWRHAEIRLHSIVDNAEARSEMARNLETMFEAARMRLAVDVILDLREPHLVILERSRNADLVMLGMARPDETEDFRAHYELLNSRFDALPTVAFVLAAEPVEFGDILD